MSRGYYYNISSPLFSHVLCPARGLACLLNKSLPAITIIDGAQ